MLVTWLLYVSVLAARIRALSVTNFRGYKTPYIERGSGKTAVVLVHGFGSSAEQWRTTIDAIADSGRSCYALNLLGLGQAEKPMNTEYSIELWAEQLESFVRQIPAQERIFLVGNSLGSLISLQTATATQIDGLALFNCAVGMNSKALPLSLQEAIEWPISWLAQPLFALVDFLLNIQPIATWIFDQVRDRDRLKTVLASVYKNPDRIDDELIDSFLKPAFDPGALEAFIAIFTGRPGPRPELLFRQVSAPIAVFWGQDDLVTPIQGPVGKFFQARGAEDHSPLEFTTFENAGHCPFDDCPAVANKALLEWLDRLEANHDKHIVTK